MTHEYIYLSTYHLKEIVVHNYLITNQGLHFSVKRRFFDPVSQKL